MQFAEIEAEEYATKYPSSEAIGVEMQRNLLLLSLRS